MPTGEIPPEIRRAEETDAQAVSGLLAEAFAEFRPLYTAEGFAATAIDPAEVIVRLREGPVWLAVLSGAPAGTVAAVTRPDGVYMRGMGVPVRLRGRGIGLALLQHVESFVIASGCSRVYLSTTPFLASAISLYERFGFRRMAGSPPDLFGTPLFTMEKFLRRGRSS
jgi:ribosomal protein S18 acetylase RimI-like enzyme